MEVNTPRRQTVTCKTQSWGLMIVSSRKHRCRLSVNLNAHFDIYSDIEHLYDEYSIS